MGWKTSSNNSLAVKLPLSKDSSTGFKMIRGIRTLFKQNLKMLLLTGPGERVMDPDFGVGLKTYLFRSFNSGVFAEIEFKINEQVKRYIPAIKINNISFDSSDPDSGELSVSIAYSIPNINVRDLLEFTI